MFTCFEKLYNPITLYITLIEGFINIHTKNSKTCRLGDEIAVTDLCKDLRHSSVKLFLPQSRAILAVRKILLDIFFPFQFSVAF